MNTTMMHMTVAKSSPIASANSLVMVYFTTTAPSCNRLNRSATAAVTADAGAARDVARLYNTVLEAKGTAVGKAISLQNQTRTRIAALGLACPAGGYYVRACDLPKIQNLYDDAQLELDKIREDILLDYPSIVGPLRAKLGAFDGQVAIPTATEVASKFTMRMIIVNRPTAIDNAVLAGLADEVVNRTVAESQQQINDMLRESHAGPIESLTSQLTVFIRAMREAKRLHLSQFDNLLDVINRVEDLNVLDLPEIDQIVTVARTIMQDRNTVDTKDGRVAAARKAEGILQVANDTLDAMGF